MSIDKLPELSSSSKDELGRVLEFCNTIIYKNQDEAEKNETLISKRDRDYLINAVNETEEFLPDPNNPTKASLFISKYVESNPYYAELLKKAGFIDSSTTLEAALFLIKAYKAEDHEIVFHQQYFEKTLIDSFLINYKACLIYFGNIYHNEGFYQYKKYWNYYNFLVTLMAVERVLTDRTNSVFDVDKFNVNDLNNFLYSHGLASFASVPTRYKRRLIKNINTLLSSKGTNVALIQIVNIFGFESVSLFKYYLAKTYTVDDNGVIEDIDDPNVPKPTDLAFIESEISETNVDKIIDDPLNREFDYESFVSNDALWDSEKEQILLQEFNILETKYISVRTSIEFIRENIASLYFYEYLFHFKNSVITGPSNTKLTMTVPNISKSPIHVLDMMVALHYLSLKLMGASDEVITDPNQLLYLEIIGSRRHFNFNPEDYRQWDFSKSFDDNMKDLLYYFANDNVYNNVNNGYDQDARISTNANKLLSTPDIYKQNRNPLSGQNIVVPDESLATPKDMITPKTFFATFKDNFDYMANFRKLINAETDYKKYVVLKRLYDYKFLSNSSKTIFNGKLRMIDYLQEANEELYSYINARDFEEVFFFFMEEMEKYLLQQKGENVRDYTNLTKEDYDTGLSMNYPNFTHWPIVIELITKHIELLINTFKAYTTQLKYFDILYIYKNPFDESVRPRESIDVFTGQTMKFPDNVISAETQRFSYHRMISEPLVQADQVIITKLDY